MHGEAFRRKSNSVEEAIDMSVSSAATIISLLDVGSSLPKGGVGGTLKH